MVQHARGEQEAGLLGKEKGQVWECCRKGAGQGWNQAWKRGWVSYHFGLEGWLHFPLLQQDPVDSLEKGMKSDVSGHSQPLDWLPLEQLQSTGALVRTQGHEKLELLQTAGRSRAPRPDRLSPGTLGLRVKLYILLTLAVSQVLSVPSLVLLLILRQSEDAEREVK